MVKVVNNTRNTNNKSNTNNIGKTINTRNKSNQIDKNNYSSPIGIFDSGVGGLTVLKEIEKLLPNENFIYFGDTKRFPFGTKSLDEVKKFAFQITRFLISKGIKLLVVACNTASAAALKELQNFFELPIIGVIEPGARKAASLTLTGKVGVIATNSTVKSKAYYNALKQINNNIEVFSSAASELVEYIERGIFNGEELQLQIKKYVTFLLDKEIDVLILGCTHFPLIEKEISIFCNNYIHTEIYNKDISKNDVSKNDVNENGIDKNFINKNEGKTSKLCRKIKLVSSALETAREVKNILESKGLKNVLSNRAEKVFYETGCDSKFLEIGKYFLGYKINEVIKVSLDS